MRKIVAYCRVNCPHSDNTKKILSSFNKVNNKINIDIISVPDNDEIKNNLKNIYNHNTFPIIIYKSKDDKSYTFGGNDKLMKIISKLDNLTTDKLEEFKNTIPYNDYKILKWLYYINKY
jgi:glutaredoxin